MSAVALILAAGEGTRMKSDLPKVAHRILGEPLVRYVVDAARDAGCERVVVITGHRAEVVEALVEDVETVRQDEQLGTGHAVMCARDALAGFRRIAARALGRHAARARGDALGSRRDARVIRRRAHPADGAPARSVRLRPHRARPGRRRGRHRRAQGPPARPARAQRGQHRHVLLRRRGALRAPRSAHHRERPGGVLPDGHGHGLQRRRVCSSRRFQPTSRSRRSASTRGCSSPRRVASCSVASTPHTCSPA